VQPDGHLPPLPSEPVVEVLLHRDELLMVSSSSLRFLATAHAMKGLTFGRFLSAKTCTFPGATR